MTNFRELSDPFPITNYQDWRQLAQQTLRGDDFERALVHETLDGICLQPIYPQSPQHALDGDFPYHRGARAKGSSPACQIRQSYSGAQPSATNSQILQELEAGVSVLNLAIDTHSPNNAAIYCPDLAALDALLAGVQLDLIETTLQPCPHNIAQIALFTALCDRRGHNDGSVQVAFNTDPLGALARHGAISPPCDYRSMLTALAEFTLQRFPGSTSICADGTVYHNGGASEAQQIAFVLATGIDYLRALTEHGYSAITAANQLSFRIALDSDFFMSIASQRALRQLWALVLDHCGAKDAAGDIRLHTESSNRSLSRYDASVNMLRVTCQAFAATIGGSDSFEAAPFDLLTTGGSDLGRRIARNTQLILTEESALDRVRDPLGGAGHIEAMTNSLAESAWAIVQQIEAAGGMYTALLDGMVQKFVSSSREKRQHDIASGKTQIIGVSEFPDLSEPLPSWAKVKPDDHTPTAPQAATTGHQFSTTTLHEMVDQLISTGACDNLSVAGNHHLRATKISPFRDAESFETMRDRSAQHHIAEGQIPTVDLITLGSSAEYTARVSYARNFFASAGIDVRVHSLTQIEQQLPISSLAILCSSNTQYHNEAEYAYKQIQPLMAANSQIWLAGQAGELLQNVALHAEIFSGCDRLALLASALNILEVA